ncbi:MAG: hypothetical protein AAF670_07500 [Planctomycetota bacterium]
MNDSEQPSFFERPRNVRMMILGLVCVCAGLAVTDLVYTNPHPHFAIESSFAFQAWFGFLAFVIIVFLGRCMRPLVSRKEDYYDGDG